MIWLIEMKLFLQQIKNMNQSKKSRMKLLKNLELKANKRKWKNRKQENPSTEKTSLKIVAIKTRINNSMSRMKILVNKKVTCRQA